MKTNQNVKSAVTYKMIAEALFENYESIYDINVETNAFKTYFQSEQYRELKLAKEGKDFFEALPSGIERTIVQDDRPYVLQMLKKDMLLNALKSEKYYRLVYRIRHEDRDVYHQLRATFQSAEDGLHILMGIKDIDDLIRVRLEHENKVRSMQQKEYNHLEAVLASAAAYLEANLTRNLVLEKSVGHPGEADDHILDIPPISEIPSYDEMQEWIGNHLIAENGERYLQISNRDYLTDCYLNGNKRASVEFSMYASHGKILPCKAVFFLYREIATADLFVFCVIYDLTDQQKKEKEMRQLEEELSMSRIRNSTSQMQPHFLYNALGSIQELILIDPQYASDLLGDFMIHMRSCVRAMSNDEPILFSEELKNIKAYTNIEKMRLGDRLTIQYDIETEDFPILPLSIQPIVENAIRHGIRNRGKAGGRVMLCTRNGKNEWIIEVADTGIGFDVSKMNEELKKGKGDSTGLKNIRFRLEKVMNADMQIRSKEGEGTLVTVRIPKNMTDPAE